MTPQTLTTAQELNNAPVGTVIIDPNGYAWQKGSHTKTISGAIRSSWFNAISGESHMSDTLEKEGPYTVIYTPTQAEPAASEPPRYYYTQKELRELDKLPIGSIVEDKDGDQWVRVNGGWIWAEAGGSDVLTPREAPYTVTHTPTA